MDKLDENKWYNNYYFRIFLLVAPSVIIFCIIVYLIIILHIKYLNYRQQQYQEQRAKKIARDNERNINYLLEKERHDARQAVQIKLIPGQLIQAAQTKQDIQAA